jgi:hypothetical protein
MSDAVEIKVDQVWQDKDTRGGERRVFVLAVDDKFVTVFGRLKTQMSRASFVKRFVLIEEAP